MEESLQSSTFLFGLTYSYYRPVTSSRFYVLSKQLQISGSFFGSPAGTAKDIVFSNSVKMGRNVVSDIIGNKETLIDSAQHRAMETLFNGGAQPHRGEGNSVYASVRGTAIKQRLDEEGRLKKL